MQNSELQPRSSPLTLAQLYARAAGRPSDIWEHIPVLYQYASTVEHITEFGTRSGVSTSAFLFARPKRLVAYDLQRRARVTELEQAALREGLNFQFIEADVRTISIEETDLLFIDTWHVYEQMKIELRQADKVRKYIILHDTETFGIQGETAGHEGIGRAIAEFLRNDERWRLERIFHNNHGLTILARGSAPQGTARKGGEELNRRE